MPDIRIGISGWTYAPWRGIFFPAGLPQKQELAYAARQVNSIEINGTFYALQRPSSFQTWYQETPYNFVFSVKAPRFITHIRRLKECETPVANFFASGLLCLKEKLGPILWQLPPSFAFDPERLVAFLSILPRDTRQAADQARRHDAHIEQTWCEADENRPLRHALEVRHASFKNESFISLLREHGVALVVADTAGKWPFMEDVTSDFVYARLHGDDELYVSGYTPEALETWAEKIRAWAAGENPRAAKLTADAAKSRLAGRDVFIYFDNDVKTHAPFDAMTLAHKLGLGLPPPPMPASENVRPKKIAPAATRRKRQPKPRPARRHLVSTR